MGRWIWILLAIAIAIPVVHILVSISADLAGSAYESLRYGVDRQVGTLFSGGQSSVRGVVTLGMWLIFAVGVIRLLVNAFGKRGGK